MSPQQQSLKRTFAKFEVSQLLSRVLLLVVKYGKILSFFIVMSIKFRGVAGKSFAGRQEVVALENYWIACKDLPMALDSMINSTMPT